MSLKGQGEDLIVVQEKLDTDKRIRSDLRDAVIGENEEKENKAEKKSEKIDTEGWNEDIKLDEIQNQRKIKRRST